MSTPTSSIHSQSLSASPTPVSLEPSPMTALYQSYHSQLENLKRLPVPYGDIYQALSSHETISLASLGSRFRSAAEALSLWLETAEMTVFGLEMDVEQEGASDKGDVGEIDVILHRFHPNIDMLLELKERIENRLVSGTIVDLMDMKLDISDGGPEGGRSGNEGELYISLTIQELCQTAEAIHSSWSSLNGMLDKVKGNLAGARVRGDLLSHIENILEEINGIDRGIDAFIAEKGRIASESSSRSSPIATPPSPTLSTLSMTSSIQSMGVAHNGDSQAKQRNLEALAQLDSRMTLVLPKIEELEAQIESLPTSETALGGSDTKRDLRGCQQQIVARWNELKARREKLGEELKEEKWLAVFEQVAGQVESMMESMERAILHCQGLIDKINNMVRDKVVPSAPIDRDHLFTIFKSFEAKHKYYAPAVSKMLGMLENGIESRMTRNQDVIQKHLTMNQTWGRLRGGLDRVEQELSGIENLLNILDGSIPSHLPTPPMQLPEKPLFSMRRSQNQATWNTPQQPLFQPPQQPQPVQRGRKPAPAASLQSPSTSTPGGRSKSPLNAPTSQRPWSPASSNSFTSFSPMLSPNMFTGFRSLSRSPSRSPSRANSDKPRPWCPSTTVTSPSIPGIPYSPSSAATYTPRPTSATGHCDRSLSPAPTPEPQSRSGSAMGSYARSRSASGTPSHSRTPSQIKPAFSPVGSNSKLSTGIPTRSTSPAPGARKPQLKVPPPVVTNQYVRMRTLSAPGPSPTSHNYMRETASAAAKVLNGPSPQTSPPVARSQSQQQRPSSRSTSKSGYKSGPEEEKPQRRRSSLSNSHFLPSDGSPPPPMPTRALKVTPQTRVYTKSGSYTYDRIDSAYGPGPGSATGSATSMGPEFSAMPPFDEPTSPSASSSSSSITSATNSRIPLCQRRPSQPYQDNKKLPGVMEDKIHIEDVAPYVPVRGEVLDEEFARIVNASPVQMEVRRLAEGKYYFGGRLEDQPAGTLTVGGKMVLCRLMEYNRLSFSGASGGAGGGGSDEARKVQEALVASTRPRSRSSTLTPVVPAGRTTRAASVGSVPVATTTTSRSGRKTRKVLVRVGGGWQDLDIFLLDHTFLANESAVVKAI
ncbi:hypothetical protein BG006_001976 [Podila minutissima]|uniref:GAR domain-containing protein n=1 Tax=Podila minutissima TaxID=64525 RepID=A0A9P5SAA4_9FUNG|nr:hypothetical protein BG006_001976 [Podila minutissima]